ncbi:MAG: hypothetical protein PHP37_04105 [Patescibacteria group bacterium]|nr:hypothetical protein [Patescibacteria group bacterium]
MAIEIIPKKREEKVFSVATIAWYVGLSLLFLAIISTVTFLLLTWRATQKIDDIKSQIEAKKSPEILLLEKEMEGHLKRTSDFVFILEKRRSPDPMLMVIEKNIHPEVYLSDLQISVDERTIRTSGIATNIVAFDQQKRLFDSEKMIVSSGINSFTRRDDGRVSFPMTIVFSEELFNL